MSDVDSTDAKFAMMDDRDIETIVFESLGEASACWNPSTGDAVFDSTRAEAIGDRLLAEIRSRITGDRTDELLAERDRLRAAVREWQEAHAVTGGMAPGDVERAINASKALAAFDVEVETTDG